jgi:hypothetical protein
MRCANPVADNPSKATEFCIIVRYTFENLAENQSTVYQGHIGTFGGNAPDDILGYQYSWHRSPP